MTLRSALLRICGSVPSLRLSSFSDGLRQFGTTRGKSSSYASPAPACTLLRRCFRIDDVPRDTTSSVRTYPPAEPEALTSHLNGSLVCEEKHTSGIFKLLLPLGRAGGSPFGSTTRLRKPSPKSCSLRRCKSVRPGPVRPSRRGVCLVGAILDVTDSLYEFWRCVFLDPRHRDCIVDHLVGFAPTRKISDAPAVWRLKYIRRSSAGGPGAGGDHGNGCKRALPGCRDSE